MKLKTTNLTGLALDWAVATAFGHKGLYLADYGRLFSRTHDWGVSRPGHCRIRPTTDWEQGGPIIERESIYLIPNENADGWFAHKVGGEQGDYIGPTPLIAAMRCYVASKIGPEIEVPDEFCIGIK